MEAFFLSEPRLDEPEAGLPLDDPLALLLSFPLDNNLCHQYKSKISRYGKIINSYKCCYFPMNSNQGTITYKIVNKQCISLQGLKSEVIWSKTLKIESNFHQKSLQTHK